MIESVLQAYGLKNETLSIEPFGNGLINHTWKITAKSKSFILQRVNETVFTQPQDIAQNLRLIADYLKVNHPDYLFVAPLASTNGEDSTYMEGAGFFRLFPFVTGSYTYNVVESPRQAYEAAKQFGQFTRLMSGLEMERLKITIPSFHDLGLRYQQFLYALDKGDPERLNQSQALIHELCSHTDIVDTYEQVRKNAEFKLRVTHHDTKISNVLFDEEGNGLCIIDLDTVMPGYFISDVGDMMRTYLSPVNEEEQDFTKIIIREDYYRAIVHGYYGQMKDVLTDTEKKYFLYAGKYMIYMQALRFLTDHLNKDVYYGAHYPGHNFIRAANQLVLLQRLLEQAAKLERITVV